jgi:hypothetical protein
MRENGQIMLIYVNRGRPREVRMYTSFGGSCFGSDRECTRTKHTRITTRVSSSLSKNTEYTCRWILQYIKVRTSSWSMRPRVQFCEWLLEHHENHPRFIQNILWTDESYFSQVIISINVIVTFGQRKIPSLCVLVLSSTALVLICVPGSLAITW